METNISEAGLDLAKRIAQVFQLDLDYCIQAQVYIEQQARERESAQCREGMDNMSSVLSDAERAKIESWAASVEEARIREREDAIVGNFGLRRTLRHLQHEKDEAAAQQAAEDAKAKAEKLAADNAAALDSRHKAGELSLWRYSSRGTDEEFEKQWPARRAELARAEFDTTRAAATNNFYRDL